MALIINHHIGGHADDLGRFGHEPCGEGVVFLHAFAQDDHHQIDRTSHGKELLQASAAGEVGCRLQGACVGFLGQGLPVCRAKAIEGECGLI